ncbi:MAG: RNase III inhibitor, partial [Anaerotignum sp.]|nr:RNase III inhibitor [Anaerotignum sp.]
DEARRELRFIRERRRLAELSDDAIEKNCSIPSCPSSVAGAALSLEDMLGEEEMTFSEALLDWLIKKDLNDPDVYKKANMDRKLFSKIRSNADYKPKKSTAIALALALELDLEETKEFIGRAGYALTHSSKFDIIIEYFIRQKNYNVFEINEVLFAYNYPLIGC